MNLYSPRFPNGLSNVFPPRIKLTLGFVRIAKCVISLTYELGKLHCVWSLFSMKRGSNRTPFCYLLLCVLQLEDSRTETINVASATKQSLSYPERKISNLFYDILIWMITYW